MKIAEFARRARAHRLHIKNVLMTGLEGSCPDRRVFISAAVNRTSAVKFDSQTKCRTEALIPYPHLVASHRR